MLTSSLTICCCCEATASATLEVLRSVEGGGAMLVIRTNGVEIELGSGA